MRRSDAHAPLAGRTLKDVNTSHWHHQPQRHLVYVSEAEAAPLRGPHGSFVLDRDEIRAKVPVRFLNRSDVQGPAVLPTPRRILGRAPCSVLGSEAWSQCGSGNGTPIVLQSLIRAPNLIMHKVEARHLPTWPERPRLINDGLEFGMGHEHRVGGWQWNGDYDIHARLEPLGCSHTEFETLERNCDGHSTWRRIKQFVNIDLYSARPLPTVRARRRSSQLPRIPGSSDVPSVGAKPRRLLVR